jgi:Zinc carboxypeptidase
VINGSDCVGVNIERNFNFNWGMDILSSNEPCSSNFRGRAGDSEEETKTIQFAVDITRRIQRAYITIRAGSTAAHSLIAYPFSSNK